MSGAPAYFGIAGWPGAPATACALWCAYRGGTEGRIRLGDKPRRLGFRQMMHLAARRRKACPGVDMHMRQRAIEVQASIVSGSLNSVAGAAQRTVRAMARVASGHEGRPWDADG